MDESQLKQLIQQYIYHCRFKKELGSKTLKACNTDLTQFISLTAKMQGHYSKETI